MRLYVASTNPGKLRDFAHAAEGQLDEIGRVSIQPLAGLANIPEPAENEDTFEGNSRVKAAYYSLYAPGDLVLADDSGLEVDCLSGAPGVRSARYAKDQGNDNSATGPATQDERNNAALLRALDQVPERHRRARYRCVLALARDGKIVMTAEGAVEGQILASGRGQGGFGYDPLFLLQEYGQTMAEVSPLPGWRSAIADGHYSAYLGLYPGF